MARWVVGSILHGVMCHWIDPSWCDGSLNRSFMVDPLRYFSFQPVLHDQYNKGSGMCYPVWDGAYKRTLAVNWKEYPMWQ